MTLDPGLPQDLESLLIDVLAGERDLNDADVAAARATPAFDRALTQLRLVQRDLDGAGSQAQADLATAAPELEAAAQRAFVRAARPQWGWRRLSGAALAAMAAAAALALLLWPTPSGSEPEPRLGGSLAIEAAAGPTFRFRPAAPPGGAFLIEIRTQGKILAQYRAMGPADSWSPPPEDASAWPEHAQLHVSLTDRDGTTLAVGSAAVRPR
jgi:hypothetical protein